MTRHIHDTNLDRRCEAIVRPVTDDFLAGHRDGWHGHARQTCPSAAYRRGYRAGLSSRLSSRQLAAMRRARV